jgi:hypothetical protein
MKKIRVLAKKYKKNIIRVKNKDDIINKLQEQ